MNEEETDDDLTLESPNMTYESFLNLDQSDWF